MNSIRGKIVFPAILLILFISLVLPRAVIAGADLENGFACALNPLDSGLPGPDPKLTTDTHSVVTPSGNSVLVCKYHGLTDVIYESAYQNAGFLCGTFAGATYHSKVVITPSGQAIFTCHVHPNSSEPPKVLTTDAAETSNENGPASSHGNGKGNNGGNGHNAPTTSDDPTIASEGEIPDQGPGNSENHGNGKDSGHGNGNSGGGNGNGNGNGGGNGNGKKDG